MHTVYGCWDGCTQTASAHEFIRTYFLLTRIQACKTATDNLENTEKMTQQLDKLFLNTRCFFFKKMKIFKADVYVKRKGSAQTEME